MHWLLVILPVLAWPSRTAMTHESVLCRTLRASSCSAPSLTMMDRLANCWCCVCIMRSCRWRPMSSPGTQPAATGCCTQRRCSAWTSGLARSSAWQRPLHGLHGQEGLDPRRGLFPSPQVCNRLGLNPTAWGTTAQLFAAHGVLDLCGCQLPSCDHCHTSLLKRLLMAWSPTPKTHRAFGASLEHDACRALPHVDVGFRLPLFGRLPCYSLEV